MSKTDIVIFSKERTLQLKSLLRSIEFHSDITEDEIKVLYRTGPEIPYEPLISQFQCHFIPEENFLVDLDRILDGSPNEYVLLMVDDLIFRDGFSLRAIEAFLGQNLDVDCFSLRLGCNIQGAESPDFSQRGDDILVWDTSAGLAKHWKFFWEVSSSIYRKDLVRRYLQKCDPERVSFPNPLEWRYYSCMPSYPSGGPLLKRIGLRLRFLTANKTNRMACFQRSRCFTHGVNRVADLEVDHTTTFEPQELHKKMEEGYVIDHRSLREVENSWPNTGAQHFRLVKERE